MLLIIEKPSEKIKHEEKDVFALIRKVYLEVLPEVYFLPIVFFVKEESFKTKIVEV